MKTPLEIASHGLRLNKTKKLRICWEEGKGRGVMAEEHIKKGEFVCEYKYAEAYPRKMRKERDEEYGQNDEGCFIMEVTTDSGKKLCLDATYNINSYGRYINHTCHKMANLKMFKPLLISGKWRVAFLSTRDIEAGEALGYDYGQEKNVPEWMKKKRKVENHH